MQSWCNYCINSYPFYLCFTYTEVICWDKLALLYMFRYCIIYFWINYDRANLKSQKHKKNIFGFHNFILTPTLMTSFLKMSSGFNPLKLFWLTLHQNSACWIHFWCNSCQNLLDRIDPWTDGKGVTSYATKKCVYKKSKFGKNILKGKKQAGKVL